MFIEMAEIVRAVGLRGEMKLLLSGDFDVAILESRYLKLRAKSGELQTAKLVALRPKGQTMIARLAGIASCEAVEALRGASLGFLAADYDRPDFPRPDPPSPFSYEGMTVVTVSGERVGEVAELLLWPGQRMLRVRRDGAEDVLVPAVPPILHTLDPGARRIIIEPIPGLLDDDAEYAG